MNLEINNREREILKYTLIHSYSRLDEAYLRKEYKIDNDISIEFLKKHYGSLDELDLLLDKLFKKSM